MDDLENIQNHLQNIRSVEPIINSLHTISAGSWRLALRRLRVAREYTEHLSQILAWILPDISEELLAKAHVQRQAGAFHRAAMLVIASERGLCGAFNDIVLTGAEQLLAQQQLQSDQVELITLGSRAETYFRAQGREPMLAQPLPVTRVATYDLVRELGETLIALIDDKRVDAVYVVYSPYNATATMPPVAERWLPVDASLLPQTAGTWPPPIIEPSAERIFPIVMTEWAFTRLYRLVIESAAAEQSARFRAMEAASTNLAKIIEELTLNYHSARQHAITMQMLDLVAGSGILRQTRTPSRTT
ncbi:MAG: F0F1 ATP synthase subunit gamma [Chloroflexi bacterium]|jgi:F-type H+-transporting ATPase subunit gamma|nr:F0F1 ATP synthase subunit gamma [Chloroflexota bacterium]